MKGLTGILMAALMLPVGVSVMAEDISAIEWQTNLDDPPIGDPERAIRGGTFTMSTPSYPLTFRLHGPNSNDMFANWNRMTSLELGLVTLHPTTYNYIPRLATHWAVMDDGKTLYFKLDERAKWSDGKPITADDYVFAAEFLADPLIRDPFSNQFMNDWIEEVVKIDDYTIKIQGKRESWKPLYQYGGFSPLPRHAVNLDDKWVETANYTPPVVQGAYTITDWREGETVTFTRIADWWGDDHHYLRGMYNPDRIVLRVIADSDRELDFFRRGELSWIPIQSARQWETEMNFEAIEKGWAHRRRVFLETPDGVSGFILNTKNPLLSNKDFRKGLQYLFNFDDINKNIMFNAYYRKASVFTGTPFENKELEPYPFDPRKAREHLEKAGFTRRGNDGILVNAAGQRASITLTYASRAFEPHLNRLISIYQRGGVEVKPERIEGGAMFKKALERAFEAMQIAMTANYYPDPHQYFHSEFADKDQNNNFWGFGRPDTDALIDEYRFGTDDQKRLEAMWKLDEIIHDEAILINGWQAPYLRFVYSHEIEWPDFYLPKMTNSIIETPTFWINPEKEKAVRAARSSGASLGKDEVVDVDPWGVKARMEEAASTE